MSKSNSRLVQPSRAKKGGEMTEREQMVRDEMLRILIENRFGLIVTADAIAQILNLTDSKGNKLLGIIGEWKDKPDSEGWWWFKGKIFIDDGHRNAHYSFSEPVAIQVILIDGKLLAKHYSRNLDIYEGKWSKALVPEIKK